MRAPRLATLTGLAGVLVAGLVGGAGPATAEPPPGWEPGPDGIRYDFTTVEWSHHGHYDGLKGNWHTGLLDVEEDDDGITGVLRDWRCPDGVTPPDAFYDPIPVTDCKVKGYSWLTNIDIPTPALGQLSFSQALNRGEVHAQVDVQDPANGFAYVRTIAVDVVIKGVGKSVTTFEDFGDNMYFDEIWNNVKAWGKVDGHHIRGTNTTSLGGRLGYWLDGWVRSTT